ncbi:hypothetical protein QWY77_02810 [Thalassotalea ponticola]|uniref:hypothetical protein n=1 Tax=Thalassotalea ponticola TaxID=1523392 RepID=UPI0025B2CC16|nr:hypothetical protein [Thalassotalea ponticola]MDN3651694.1 hypothetical protein [Thalassotalea ponticola]
MEMKLRKVIIILHIIFAFNVLATEPEKINEAKGYCESFQFNIADNVQPPQNIEKATYVLLNSIPKAAKADFLENEGSFRSCPPNLVVNRINIQLEKYWNLGSNEGSLVSELNKMGFWGAMEQTRLLLTLTWYLGEGKSVDLNLPVRQKFLIEHDQKPVLYADVPCTFDTKQNFATSDTMIGGYSRFLRWAQCENGDVINYLWERGWFKPSESEFRNFCEEPLGDQESFCK